MKTTAIRRQACSIMLLILVCLLLSFYSSNCIAQHNPLFGAGNSYVNLSKQNNGGFIQTGDTLEIRTNYFFGPTYNAPNYGTNGNRYQIYNVRYFDSVPINTTILNGTLDSLRLITNEGLTFRKYTLAAGDDAAVYNATPPAGQYQIRINIGSTPSNPGAVNPGLISNNTGSSTLRMGFNKPRIFGGLLLTTAFRVRVTGSAGDTITLGAGKLVYQKTASGADTVVTAIPYKILISSSTASTLCANGLGPNLASEFRGTFDSGTVQNRISGPIYAIPSYDYKPLTRTATTSDGSYAIVNNSSPTSSTNNNSKMQPNCTAPAITDSCANRMHGGFWDIMGDHTGTSNAIGNPAVSPGTRGGYMLMVNADVVTSEAYRQLVTGLCPDTYYEYSAWVKNICKRCGIDSNSNATYAIGVKPNLAFSINNLDIYSTGGLDSLGWIKKGFVFRTGPTQTTATISIRNNASGGGGNDWVIDDIAIGTCGPTTSMNYKPVLLGCQAGVQVDLYDTIRYSYNPNYAWYKWERSTDGGVTWNTPPTPVTGMATPTLVNGLYQFVTSYPSFIATAADSGHLYRVVLATSNANLSSGSCSFTDGNYVMIRTINCTNVLPNLPLYFKGKLDADRMAEINWTIQHLPEIVRYELEKSRDGRNFFKIHQQLPDLTGNIQSFQFNDPEVLNGNAYYRLKVFTNNGLYKLSKTVLLNSSSEFSVNSLINPFNTDISCDVIVSEDGLLRISLFDAVGKRIYQQQFGMTKGLNPVRFRPAGKLSKGVYLVVFEFNNTVIQKRITHAE